MYVVSWIIPDTVAVAVADANQGLNEPNVAVAFAVADDSPLDLWTRVWIVRTVKSKWRQIQTSFLFRVAILGYLQ